MYFIGLTPALPRRENAGILNELINNAKVGNFERLKERKNEKMRGGGEVFFFILFSVSC
jgi:hypothetical protein